MECDPKDIAIKSFFLGPQAENSEWLENKWHEILKNWISWRKNLFPSDGSAISPADQKSPSFLAALLKLDQEVNSILRELENETPKFTPRYIGHMVSEISLPALLGHVCALLHNPNNTSREVSRVTSRLEDEAIHELGEMIGFSNAQGHFTSGGTMANFEALWHAIVRHDAQYGEKGPLSIGPWNWAKDIEAQTGKPFPGFAVMVPGNKHYSWEKAVTLMGLGANSFITIALDEEGRLDVQDLDLKIQQTIADGMPILMVVSVAGTTEMGEIDPIHLVQDVLDKYKDLSIWHHVDAAFGGYFTSMLDGSEMEARFSTAVSASLRSIGRVDSVTLDPHKLGYVPYACGAFLVRDEEHYRTKGFNAAYLLSKNKSKWALTLEGSRTGSGVAATWLSNRVLGLNSDGYGRLLGKGLEARKILVAEMQRVIPDILVVEPGDLNVVCFSFAPKGERLSKINEISNKIWKHFEASPNFSVSKTILRKDNYHLLLQRMGNARGLEMDSDEWIQIRLVLMNPFLISKEMKVNLVQEFINELSLALKA